MTAHFGLDIGSYSIKAVQVEKKETQYRLVGLGEARTPASLASESEKDKRAIAETIRKITKEAGIRKKEAALSLAESAVYSRVINLPYLSEKELASAIKFEAEQYIPIPLKEVQLEYLVLSEAGGGQGGAGQAMEILLVAAQKKAIDKLVVLVEMAGLIPVILETEILSLIRVVNLGLSDNCLVLDIGNQSTTIAILENKNLKFVRSLRTSGEAFSRAVSQELNMDFFQAEKYKHAYGLNSSALEGRVAKAIAPIFEPILNEVKKSLNFFSQRPGGGQIRTIVLSGGSALMASLSTYLAQALNLQVLVLNPFSFFIQEGRLKELQGTTRFSTAVGLAIRED